MRSLDDEAARADRPPAVAALLDWIVTAALPHWSVAGIDARGGFAEALGFDGRALDLPRRARVQPRQVFVFCHARELGWNVEIGALVRQGIDAIESRYRRPDGFYRTLVSSDGIVLDDTALLYDQAFVLLALAAAARVIEARATLESRAIELRERISRQWRVGRGEFRSGETDGNRREANPHLHLLEACLAWSEVSSDPVWRQWVDDLVQAALGRFLDPASGALFEAYDGDRRSVADPDGHAINPGHQYEWAWLLMRAQPQAYARPGSVALRLIDLAETHGVHRGVAVNALDGRLAVRDANARLWVQTERLRACAAAYRICPEERYKSATERAARSILPYLATTVPGLWYDQRTPGGEYLASVVHASTLYHLVGAALALR